MCSCGIGGFCTGAVVGSAYTCTTIMKYLKQLGIEAHPCDIKSLQWLGRVYACHVD